MVHHEGLGGYGLGPASTVRIVHGGGSSTHPPAVHHIRSRRQRTRCSRSVGRFYYIENAWVVIWYTYINYIVDL